MKQYPYALLVLAAILLLAAPSPAAGGGVRDTPITLGSPPPGWPPYYLAEGNAQAGIMPDIFMEATRSLGREATTLPLPEKRLMLHLAQGTVDVYTKAMEWVADPSLFLWSAPVVASSDVLLFRAGEAFDYPGTDRLEGRSLVTVLGFRYPTLEPLFASGKVKRVDAVDARCQLRMLKCRRGDAAVVNRHVALWLMREDPQLDPEEFRFAERPLATAESRFVFSRRREWGAFIRDLDREIERMRADGRMQAILARYR